MAVIEVDDRTSFGPYRIIRCIGSGGMGDVFEAEDTGLGHRVALKLLHPHVAMRPGAARRFLREGRAAARIRHPHVVQVFALGTEGQTPYLAMELLDGGSLSDLVASRGALDPRDALDLVLPVIAAVAAAHDAGVIHRDLKPSNVCIARRPGGRAWPKVVDFGVSKVISDAGNHESTATETVIGTAAYMAPEQARAANRASFRSDQYSLAVMLYQCITGRLPFAGQSLYEILESVVSGGVAPPSTYGKGVPPALDAAILRGMSRNAGDRFPSVRAFGAALLHAASQDTRAAYAAEMLGQATTDSDGAIVTDIAPALASAGASVPRSSTTTLSNDWTAPPTESSNRPKARTMGKSARWIALVALFGSASFAMGLAAPVGVRNTPSAASGLDQPPIEAPPPSPSTQDTESNEVGLSAPQTEWASPVTSSAPVAPPSATAHAASTATTLHAERLHRPPAVVRYGDNGAPILP